MHLRLLMSLKSLRIKTWPFQRPEHHPQNIYPVNPSYMQDDILKQEKNHKYFFPYSKAIKLP